MEDLLSSQVIARGGTRRGRRRTHRLWSPGARKLAGVRLRMREGGGEG